MIRIVAVAFLALLLAACAGGPPPVQPGSERRIALTFDDIPRAPGAFLSEVERTRRLIAGMRRAGVKQAALFLNPGLMPQRPGASERITAYVRAGHVIANHSHTHPRLSATSVKDYLADIDSASAFLAGRRGYRPWFRFPFLDEGMRDKVKRDAVRAGLDARGLANGYVTVDASDWWLEQAAIEAKAAGHAIDMAAFRDLYVESHVEAAAFNDGLMRRTLGRAPVQVMLLHETDIAALWIADLVKALRADGWTIVTADEAFADPIARLRPDMPNARGTFSEAIAWAGGAPAPRWYERNDARVYSRLFRERVLHLAPEDGVAR